MVALRTSAGHRREEHVVQPAEQEQRDLGQHRRRRVPANRDGAHDKRRDEPQVRARTDALDEAQRQERYRRDGHGPQQRTGLELRPLAAGKGHERHGEADRRGDGVAHQRTSDREAQRHEQPHRHELGRRVDDRGGDLALEAVLPQQHPRAGKQERVDRQVECGDAHVGGERRIGERRCDRPGEHQHEHEHARRGDRLPNVACARVVAPLVSGLGDALGRDFDEPRVQDDLEPAQHGEHDTPVAEVGWPQLAREEGVEQERRDEVPRLPGEPEQRAAGHATSHERLQT